MKSILCALWNDLIMDFVKMQPQKGKNSLMIVLVSMIVFCLVVFLDIPVARQIFGFLYLLFVPGFVFLNLFKTDRFDGVEKVLFMVGISVAFLMIFGLLVNEFSLIIGFSEPLSVLPLMIVLNSAILVGTVLVYLRNSEMNLPKIGNITKSPFVLLYLCLPFLSIIGSIYVNVYGDNSILLFTIISIVVMVVLGALSKKLLPTTLHPIAVVMIAISILFHVSLISKYIVPFASDVPAEYFLFQNTQNNGYWDSVSAHLGRFLGTYNDMLSITILPTVFSNLLNLEATLLFKILYPLIFSLVPLGAYQIWQSHLSKRYAFLATFLLVSQSTFYTEMFGLNRQIIAELFFVLLILTILHKKIRPNIKMTFFALFSFTLVASHYALAEIFLIFLCFIVAYTFIFNRPRKNITLGMVLLFFVIMFTWYVYTSNSATFSTIAENGDKIYSQLGNFFDLSSRGETVLTGLGLAESPSVWNTISRVVAYVTQGLIVLGFLAFVTKRSHKNIQKEYLLFSFASIMFLGMLIIVPGLANTLNMTRFYHILLFFLAPLCVVGAEFIVRLFSKRKRIIAVTSIVLIVLVPYFLFQSNFMYEVTGSDSWSVPLSGYRMDRLRLYGHYGYADDFSVYGSLWLSENANTTLSTIYGDESSTNNLLPLHGLIVSNKITLTNTTQIEPKGLVYLSTLNTVDDAFPYRKTSWNSSELAFSFNDLNLIYTNGNSEIYQKP